MLQYGGLGYVRSGLIKLGYGNLCHTKLGYVG